jgi:hypothetical protein
VEEEENETSSEETQKDESSCQVIVFELFVFSLLCVVVFDNK